MKLALLQVLCAVVLLIATKLMRATPFSGTCEDAIALAQSRTASGVVLYYR